MSAFFFSWDPSEHNFRRHSSNFYFKRLTERNIPLIINHCHRYYHIVVFVFTIIFNFACICRFFLYKMSWNLKKKFNCAILKIVNTLKAMRRLLYCAIRYALWGLAEIYKVRDIIFICPKWQLIGSEFSIVLFCRISPRRDKVMNDSLVSMRSFPC